MGFFMGPNLMNKIEPLHAFLFLALPCYSSWNFLPSSTIKGCSLTCEQFSFTLTCRHYRDWLVRSALDPGCLIYLFCKVTTEVLENPHPQPVTHALNYKLDYY